MTSKLQRLFRTALALILMTSLSAARADACGLLLRVTFAEDYPDWFFIEFLDGEGYELKGLRIDLGPAAGRPLIDTAFPVSRHSGGGGVQVTEFAGFDTGSRDMTFRFAHFVAGKSYRLLVDLDGRLDQLENEELRGARVAARFAMADGKDLSLGGLFDSAGVAELGSRACT